MVGTDFEGLISAHDQPCLAVLLVLEQSDVASTSLLPFTAVAVKLEQLGTHLKGLLLGFFMSLGIDFLGQTDDRLEVSIGFFFFSLLLHHVPG